MRPSYLRAQREEGEKGRDRKSSGDGSAPNADHGFRNAASERGDGVAVCALATTGTAKLLSRAKLPRNHQIRFCGGGEEASEKRERIIVVLVFVVVVVSACATMSDGSRGIAS
jgi:hypothetical protein